MRRILIKAAFLVFVLAFGVRFPAWEDQEYTVLASGGENIMESEHTTKVTGTVIAPKKQEEHGSVNRSETKTGDDTLAEIFFLLAAISVSAVLIISKKKNLSFVSRKDNRKGRK